MTKHTLQTILGVGALVGLFAIALTSPVVAVTLSQATSTLTPSESMSLVVFGCSLAASAQLARRRSKG